MGFQYWLWCSTLLSNFQLITQSEKFDPKGIFIRKYIPELQNIPDKHVHFPHDYIAKTELTANTGNPSLNTKKHDWEP